jgi:hypothetical protein
MDLLANKDIHIISNDEKFQDAETNNSNFDQNNDNQALDQEVIGTDLDVGKLF